MRFPWIIRSNWRVGGSLVAFALCLFSAPSAHAVNFFGGDLVNARTNPVPHERASEVPLEGLGAPRIQRLVGDLRSIMLANLGIGLAAPQIGVPLRVIVVMKTRTKAGALIPLRNRGIAMINPTLKILDPTRRSFIEGCLSLPFFYKLVSRPSSINVVYSDERGAMQNRDFDDYTATIVQHEIDHLDGRLISDD